MGVVLWGAGLRNLGRGQVGARCFGEWKGVNVNGRGVGGLRREDWRSDLSTQLGRRRFGDGGS